MKRFILYGIVLIFMGCSQQTSSAHEISFTIPSDRQTIPIVIIGGGVAGLTAGLYGSQAGIETLIIEGEKEGGALAQSHSVRNWPGVIEAPGNEITTSLKGQVQQSKTVKIVQESCTEVNLTSWPYKIVSKDLVNDTVTTRWAQSCIIATGSEPRYLGIPGEREAWGRGVSNCAVCDGALYQNKVVGIVGGGDAAVSEGLYLSDIAREVIIFIRKDHVRAKDLEALKTLQAKKNVSIRFNSSIQSIHFGQSPSTVTVMNNESKKQEIIQLDGLFLAIGSDPNTRLFKQQLSCNEAGFITLTDHQATSVPGVFAAGDVCDPYFIQAVTAAGQGCMAMLQAQKFLERSVKRAEKNNATNNTTQQALTKSTSGSVVEIGSEEDFQSYIMQSDIPVILDIFSPLCIPCKAMAPVLDTIACEQPTIQVAKLNISTRNFSPQSLLNLIQAPSIQSVPTLDLF